MSDASFLPEDYLAKQAEKRTNLISLTLFVVVMGAVFGAFLVTNQQASAIRAKQSAIDSRFQEAALQIDKLTELESQRDTMLNKAELATALLERVPRSILLAELINRMPERLSLQEFKLKSVEMKSAPPPIKQTGRLSANRTGRPERTPTREEAMQDKAVEAPRYRVEITMVGIAPTDLEVSRYIAELNAYQLLDSVTLKYSIQSEIEEQHVREFRVEMKLDPNADIREIDPIFAPRDGLRDPLSDELRYTVPDVLNLDTPDLNEGDE